MLFFTNAWRTACFLKSLELIRIRANLNGIVDWAVPVILLFFGSPSFFSKPLATIPRVKTFIGIFTAFSALLKDPSICLFLSLLSIYGLCERKNSLDVKFLFIDIGSQVRDSFVSLRIFWVNFLGYILVSSESIWQLYQILISCTITSRYPFPPCRVYFFFLLLVYFSCLLWLIQLGPPRLQYR